MKATQGGFTLIELLIVMSIMAGIGVVSFQLVATGLQMQNKLDQDSEQFNTVARTWWKLQADLQQLIDRPIKNEYGQDEPALTLDSNQLSFTRAGWLDPMDTERPPYLRVEYRQTENSLKRSFWQELDRPPGSQRLVQNFSSVQSFKVEVLTNEQEWVDTWPRYTNGQEEKALPLAIRLTLAFDNLPEISRIFVIPSYLGNEEAP
ncbi:type II secretion system minor pseudopilin GspJ [Marinomonas sp. THO17]|uniref:type II secretion system minor pseudopilin GspJ n=1 Tax=Marinomonas sp. THO17 TaxID=3149048 RepID=UPI00336BFF1A